MPRKTRGKPIASEKFGDPIIIEAWDNAGKRYKALLKTKGLHGNTRDHETYFKIYVEELEAAKERIRFPHVKPPRDP